MKPTKNKAQVGLPSRIIRKIKRFMKTNTDTRIFETPDDYWETRYQDGGRSGSGSVGDNRLWKWQVIERYVNVTEKRVLDIGCGDLSFWEGREPASYVGMDFSPTVIGRNQSIRSNWEFIHGDASADYNLEGDVVLCLDMLFHIMSDDVYSRILRNLAKWTKEWLFIYTWHKSPFGNSNTDGKYQYYRPLVENLRHLSPLQLVDSEIQNEYGTLYIFKMPTI